MNKFWLCGFALVTMASCMCRVNCVKEPGFTVVDILLTDGSIVSRQFYAENLRTGSPITEDSITAFKAIYANITDSVVIRRNYTIGREDKCVNCKEKNYYEKSGYDCHDKGQCSFR